MESTLSFDFSEIHEAIAEVESLLEHLSEPPPEIIEGLLMLLESGDIIGSHDTLTVGAGKTCLRFQPANSLLNLLATIRALETERAVAW
ncbi:MAG: hypothetical protein OXH85_02465 [Truepera sp.]|nr:hypothetical protein [Truepera sp.]